MFSHAIYIRALSRTCVSKYVFQILEWCILMSGNHVSLLFVVSEFVSEKYYKQVQNDPKVIKKKKKKSLLIENY